MRPVLPVPSQDAEQPGQGMRPPPPRPLPSARAPSGCVRAARSCAHRRRGCAGSASCSPLAALMVCGARSSRSGGLDSRQGHARAGPARTRLRADLGDRPDVKPWSWADTWPVAHVSVPRLGRSAIVLAGASGQALAFGPGHVERTPAAGEPGTAIFSAHRDTHFAFLGEVVIGDEIGVTRRDGGHFRFRVTGISVVRWDASGIDPLADGRRLVLVTCWPLDCKILRTAALRRARRDGAGRGGRSLGRVDAAPGHGSCVIPELSGIFRPVGNRYRTSVSASYVRSRRTIPHLSAQRGRRQGTPRLAVAEQSRT